MENNGKSNGWSDIIGTEQIEDLDTNFDVAEKAVKIATIESKEEKPDKEACRVRVTPPINRDDSIVKRLLYGGPGSGKTRAAIAHFQNYVLPENNDAIYWYIDTDRGLTETLKEFDISIDKHIEVFKCSEFKDGINALKVIFNNIQKGDVVTVDTLTKFWDWAQQTYTLQVFDEDLTEFYMARRKELVDSNSKQGVLHGWKDWVGVKLLHNKDFLDELIMKVGATPIGICSAKVVDTNNPEKGYYVPNPDVFTPVGWAPEGERHNDYRFDRVIYFWPGNNNWYMKAPKWRGNDDMLLKTITIPKKGFPEI